MRPRQLPALILGSALALAALAAVIYAFVQPSTTPWKSPKPPGPAQILHADLKRDYQNAILSLDIAFHNTSPDPVRIEPPFAQLLSSDVLPVAPFALGPDSLPDPVLPPGKKKTFQLRYWLEPDHFTSSLDFLAGTTRIPVKSPAPFPLDSLENQTSLALSSPDWKPDTP